MTHRSGSVGPLDRELEAEASSLAALSICESLALSLIARGLLPQETVQEAVSDAAHAHRNSAENSAKARIHRRAAEIAERIQTSLEASAESFDAPAAPASRAPPALARFRSK